MATRRKTKADREISARIDRAYGRACHGIQVPILQLTTIHRAGLAAVAEGVDDAELERRLLASALTVGGVRS